MSLSDLLQKIQNAPLLSTTAGGAQAVNLSAPSFAAAAQGVNANTASAITGQYPYVDQKPIFMSSINYDDNENRSARETVYYLRDQKTLYGENTLNDCYRHEGQTICGLEMVANGERSTIKVWNEDKQEYEEVSGAQAMADSYDSELDLYIEQCIEKFIKEDCGGDTSYWWDGRGFLTENKQRLLLEKYNIAVSELDNRTFTFSLVDVSGCPEDMDILEYARTEAPILEDANGAKGSIIWGDWVIPDGFAQGAELNLSSMLDVMGFDLISQADFVGHEAEFEKLITDIGSEMSNFNNGKGSQFIKTGSVSASQYIEDKYDGTTIISLASGGGGSRMDQEEFDRLVALAREMDIDLEDLYTEEDTYEEAKEKVKEALKEKGVSEEKFAEIKEDATNKILNEAIEEYEKQLEENPNIDQDNLLEEIAREYEIEVDILKKEI